MYYYLFSQVTPNRHKSLLIGLLIATIVFIGIMQRLNAPLINEVAAKGIVSFELAGSWQQSQAIINSWDGLSKSYASFSIGIDYLFLLLYSSTIALVCFMLMDGLARDSLLYPLGKAIIFMQMLAAFADILENTSLIQLLFGSNWQYWPVLARDFAIFKFIMILLGLIYLLLLGLRLLIAKAH